MQQHNDARLRWDGIPRIVHVLAGTRHQALAAQAVIHRAATTIRRKVVPDLRACDSLRDPFEARLPFDGCAAILVLDADALESSVLRGGLDELLRAFSTRGDLRLFVAMDGIADSAHPVLETLKETVQLTTPTSLNAIEGPLAEYLDHLQDAQDAAQWRGFRYTGAILAGRLAAAIQYLSLFVVTSSYVAMNLSAGGWLTGHEEASRHVVAVSAGVINFWANSLPLFYLLRGAAAPSIAAVKEPWMPRWFMLGATLSIGTLWVAEKAGASMAWLALGMAVGACVDAVRRFGLQAQRAPQGLATFSALRPDTLVIPRPGRFGHSNPFSCPLWPDLGRSVVISYARSSSWASDVAARLYNSLADKGALPFLDLKDIPVGSNWRLELQHEIGRGSTLICLLDDTAAARPWVAAELYAAMRGQVRTGSPHVIIVLHPEFQQPSDIPIFRSILDIQREPTSILVPPRIVRLSPYSVDVIAWGLAPDRFRQAAVIPPNVAMQLERLLLPVTALGACAGPLGLLAWPLWIIEMWKNNPVLGALGVTGAAAFLAVAFWFGFAARLAVISRYRVRHDDPKSLAAAHLFTAIGFAALALAWWRTFTPLVQGWSAVVALAGWWRAGRFVAFATLGDGTGTRPD
jgi:hypothetical protein